MVTWALWCVFATVSIAGIVVASKLKTSDSRDSWLWTERTCIISIISLMVAIILQPLYVTLNAALAVIYTATLVYVCRYAIKAEIAELKEYFSDRFKKS